MVNKHDACGNCAAAVGGVFAVIMGTELTYSQQAVSPGPRTGGNHVFSFLKLHECLEQGLLTLFFFK